MDLPRDFVIVDTETTGPPPGARLVEIGAIRIRGKHIADRFQSLIFPETPIPEQSREVHGIRDEDVSDAPTAGEVLPRFFEWAAGRPLLAHNASFDATILAVECARLGIPIPENPMLCTLRAARRVLNAESNSLENLVRFLGLPEGLHHRAMEDAEHTFHLFSRMREVAGAAFRRRTMGPERPLCTYLPDPPKIPRSRRVLVEAANQGEAIDLRYTLKDRQVRPLIVSPRYFFRRGRTVFMEALCHHDLYYKSYRIDRIVAAQLYPDAGPVSVRRFRYSR